MFRPSFIWSLSADAAEITNWDPGMSIENHVGYGDSPFYDGLMHRFAWSLTVRVSVAYGMKAGVLLKDVVPSGNWVAVLMPAFVGART